MVLGAETADGVALVADAGATVLRVSHKDRDDPIPLILDVWPNRRRYVNFMFVPRLYERVLGKEPQP